MTKDELIETLAEIEHVRWADWQGYFFGKCEKDDEGNLVIPAGYVTALQALIDRPYADLTDDQKENDRQEVRRYWPLIEPLFEIAEVTDTIEWPVIVTLPRCVYDYLAETYDDDPDVAATIRDICVSMREIDVEAGER